MTIWSPEVEEWKNIISAGGYLLRVAYAVTACIASELYNENLLSVLLSMLVREKMEVNVEFSVAHMLTVVTLPDLADSKATIIVVGRPDGTLGTHSVLPLLAMICSNIFVAMLCRFFLRSVASVVI
jgi:hypothetical protein